MKLQVRVTLLLLAVIAICASFTWQSARIADLGVTVEASGFSGFSQIGLFLSLQILGLFGLRYWNRVGSLIATALVTALSFASIWPLLGTVASGDFRIIQSQVTKLTGIADWQSQTDVLANLSVNTPAVLITLGVMLSLTLWSIRGAFVKRQAKQASASEWLD